MKNMKNKILLVALSLLTFCFQNRIEAGEPTVGAKPPPLQLEKVLQAPAGARASWDALKGKVVILEFWATWCGPCIAAIPHLNELADEFKGKPVQFIAITDEEENVVAPFLKKKSIHAWVGLDTDKSMHKDYAISGIPHTVVIDRKGKVAAITYPTALTKQHLEDLLAGKKLALAAPERGKGLRAGHLPGSKNEAREPLFQVLIRPSDVSNSSSASGQGNITTLGSTVLDVLSSCYGINSVRVVTNSSLPDGKYDFVVTTAAKRAKQPGTGCGRQWKRPSANAIRETREMDVYVLTATNPEATKLIPTVSRRLVFQFRPRSYAILQCLDQVPSEEFGIHAEKTGHRRNETDRPVRLRTQVGIQGAGASGIRHSGQGSPRTAWFGIDASKALC
jgi:thiol-disulfide isomerase/thioredoxin